MRFLSLLFCLLLSFSALAQKRIKFYDLTWQERDPSLLVPEIFEDEDAVILERKRRWDLTKREAISRRDFEQFYYRIRFLSYEGVEKYGYGIIPIKEGALIRRVDLRISHPDGTTYDLRARSLKKFIMREGTELFPKEEYILIKVPVLLPGDELEVFFEYDGVALAPRSYFHDFLPIVRSEIIVSHDDYEPILRQEYNGVPEALSSEELHVVDLRWVQMNVEVEYFDPHSVPENYLPHIAHAYEPAFFEERDLKLAWSGYAKQTAQVQFRFEKTYDKQLELFLQETWKGIPFEDKWNRIRVVHERINREVSVHTNPYNRVSLGYALRNRSVYYDDLILFYVDLFDRLEVHYSIGLGRDYRTGELDSSYHSLTQITHYGFRWPTSSGNFAFVFPKHPHAGYTFNEMPFELKGTDILLLQIEKPHRVDLVRIPEGASEDNMIFGSLLIRDPYQDSRSNTEFELTGDWYAYLMSFKNGLDFEKSGGEGNKEKLWNLQWDKKERIFEEVVLLPAELDRSAIHEDSLAQWDLNSLFPIIPIELNRSAGRDIDLFIPHIQKLQIDIPRSSGSEIEWPESAVRHIPGIGRFQLSIEENPETEYLRLTLELELYKRHYSGAETTELMNLLNFACESRTIGFPPIP
jgi:hypothetical protein